ncbi:hypothetical protein TL16_g00565 [Triparma laevis f. inornata]|uniref:Uncharacterized protein n=2 Tax=Triparma laevis TaxID=1534972 RepID=A0A9W7FLK8_9STRA|nr:hypothetical protein TL16_g00565 [Triparma laevis f. inornata]GMI14250.1 hypothetical protein TrLO_g13074 [Triparma laevis f. longispina]
MDDADPILYPTQSTSAEVPRAALVVCHLCYYKGLNASMVGYDTSTTIKYNIIQTVSMSYPEEEEDFGEKVASFFEGTTGIIIQVSVSAVVLLTAIGTMIYKAHRRSILEQVGNNTGPITTNGGFWYSSGAGGE